MNSEMKNKKVVWKGSLRAETIKSIAVYIKEALN